MRPSAAPAVRLLPVPAGAEGFAAVDKEAGRAVHGRGGLLDDIRAALGPEATPAHRLDRVTTGVLLVALTPEALRAAHAAWSERVEKTYVTVTRGVPAAPEGEVEAPILENRSGRPEALARALRAAYGPARAGHLLSGRRVGAIPPVPLPGRSAVHPAGRSALTAYRVLEARGDRALVEVRPREGRLHQIRVHLAHLGIPVLGDPFYDPAARGETPFLHARELVFRDPPGTPPGTVWVFASPVPRPVPGWDVPGR